MDADDLRRRRAAHHEAAHAVLVVAERFMLNHTFLTRATTTDQSLGGCTDWSADRDASAWGRARVFYAGQYAERHLASLDPEVLVPDHDANWANDEADADGVLAPIKQTDPFAERTARRETAELVTKLWRAIASVAAGLYEPQEGPAPRPQQCKAAMLPPASRVIPAEEVLRYFGEDRIAEGAFVRFKGRASVHGQDVDDWLDAQKAVAAAYPEIVRCWITDDNQSGPPFTARFLYESPLGALRGQAAFAKLSFLGWSVSACDSELTVGFGNREHASTIAERAVHSGGTYVRLRSGVSLR